MPTGCRLCAPVDVGVRLRENGSLGGGTGGGKSSSSSRERDPLGVLLLRDREREVRDDGLGRSVGVPGIISVSVLGIGVSSCRVVLGIGESYGRVVLGIGESVVARRVDRLEETLSGRSMISSGLRSLISCINESSTIRN